MRRSAIFFVATAVLLAPSFASAQRVSLADRVAALETRAAGDQSGTELVNQMTQLRQEVQDLRGQLEELQQQLEKNKQSQRAQYLDLSGRLDRLEGGKPATAGTPTAETPVSTNEAATAPAPTSALAGKDEQGAYNHAFEALKSGDYVESARRLRGFLDTFPNGQLAANALYWLGESYYVTQNYTLAIDQFKMLLNRYPTHDKAPGALLKLGLSQQGLRQSDAAATTLKQVVQRYPGTDVARIADERLRSIQFTSNR